MSSAPARLPRTAWLAAGAAAAAGAIAVGTTPAAPVVAGLALAAGAAWSVTRPLGARRVAAATAGLGAAIIGARALLGPVAAAAPPLPEDGGPWTAVVESVGSPRGGDQVARLRLTGDVGGVVVAATLPGFPIVAAGAVVEVEGRLRPPPDDDPYGEYLRRSGASGSLDARRVRVLRPPVPVSVQALRDGAGDALRRALPEPEAGLAAGILIGLRERVDRGLAADFATAGVSHVVAISGWNIAIVAAVVGAVLRGRPRRLVTTAVLATVVAYVVAAGASPSVVRAAVMAGTVLIARETGRAGRAPAALGAAVAILLLADPAMIGDAGFRLSVLATAGLLAWANRLGSALGALGGGRIPGWLAESLGISLAAQAATLPDVLVTFGRLSLVAPVVNLAVVPLVPAAMAGGLVAMAGGAGAALGAPPVVATIAGLPGWLVLHVIVWLVRTAAALPFAAVTLPPEAAGPAAVVAALLVLAATRAPGVVRRLRHRARRAAVPTRHASRRRPAPSGIDGRTRALLAVTAIVVAIAGAAFGDATHRATRLTVLDVGQGDAILLESRTGGRMLIDGGPDPGRLLVALDERIPPWDRRIDVVILTHPHEDHVAGLVRVLERYAVGRVYEPGMHGPGPGWEAWDAALRHGPPRGTLATGARIVIGEVRLTALWPDPGTVPVAPAATGRGINDVSIVLLGEANGRRFLLTGDAEDDVDPHLIERGLPHLDVLKVAHHGSATATSQALLDATTPSIAVISVGAGNDYGHPAPSTLARLHAAGARVYRTDRDGTVSLELREDGVAVATSGARRTAGIVDTGVRGPVPGIAVDAGAVAPPPRYDAAHDDPRAGGGRRPAALPGPARVVPGPRVRRRRRLLVAGPPGCRPRAAGRRAAGRGRGAAPRRGQAPVRGAPRPPPAR